MDIGEGIYTGLAALASGIARRKQFQYERDLESQAKDLFSQLSTSGFTQETLPGTEGQVFNPQFGQTGMQSFSPPSQETVAAPIDPRIMSLMGQLAQNPQGQGMLNTFLKAREAAVPKISIQNQEYGGLQQVTQYPSGRTAFKELREPDRSLMRMNANSGLTELAKLQNELAAIRANDPNDPRIKEHEAVIKRLQLGVPNYQTRVGDQGQYLTWDPKRGEWVAGPTVFSQTPNQIRDAASKLQNVKESASKIREIVNRASITGPVTGRARKLGARFFSDKDAQRLIGLVGQLRPIIYGLSGKQINESEQKWLDTEILPKLAQPDENFDVTLDLFSGWVDQTLGNMQGQFPSLKIGGTKEETNLDEEIDKLERELGIKK